MSDSAASWAGVVATTAAVIVALFQPRIFSRIWRPSVDIKGDILYVSVDKGAGQIEGRGYARLEVEAQKNRPAAEDLRVYLLSCDPPATLGGRPDLTRTKFHIPLRWAYSHTEAATLAPGIPSYVDLAELSSERPETVRLLTHPQPREGYLLPSRERKAYTIRIAVAARNMPAQGWEVALKHRGGWRGDPRDLERALGVAQPSRSR